MSIHKANPEHEVAYNDLTELLRKHAGHVSAIEMLAIAANLVGKLVALQDQRKVTPAMALKIVGMNVEVGNLQAIEQLSKSVGNA
jgi:hypothetical protein